MAAPSPSPAGAATPVMLAGRYRLERRFATGGMSEVWVATDTVLDRQVAVKVLKPVLAADPVVVERFRREAIAAAGLNHPSIVSVYDTASDGGREAVIMELVPGRSLRALLDERGRLRVDDTLAIGRSVASALDAAHRAGLVHRDVKPGNILITPEGRVKLADFGIAKAIEAREDLTADNVMMGTAKYLSPEQVLGHPLDGRSDLYSLGLVLYECLAGSVPFVASSDAATAVARLHGDPPDLRQVRTDVPPAVADAVHTLLGRRPSDRPSDAAACRVLLAAAGARGTGDTPGGDRLATTPPGSPRPIAGTTATGVPSEERGARGRGVLIAGVAAALVVAGGAVALTRGDSGPSTAGASTAATTVAEGDAGTVPATSPGAAADAPVASTVAGAVVPSGPATITGISEFDPAPGDGQEDPGGLAALTDGNPDTTWRTVCYESAFFYPKEGVGLVLTLDAPAAGHDLRITWPDGPWGVKVFVAETPGATLDAWGEPVARQGGDAAGETRLSLGSSTGTHVLVWLTQMAASDACADNPYRGAIGELAVEPVA